MINDTYEIKCKTILESLNNCEDVAQRKLKVKDINFSIIFIQDITNSNTISDFIIKPISELDNSTQDNLKEYIIENVITGREVKENTNYSDSISELLKGKTLIVCDKLNCILSVDTTQFKCRSITEPPIASVIKGPREGFTENIKDNLGLIRKRLATSNLVIKSITIGRETNTLINVLYLKNIADKSIVDKVIERISNIDIDGIVDSHYIANYLQDRRNSIFKQVGSSEKPDVITAKMLEGRIAIIVDGSPLILTVPYILYESFQDAEDYYKNFHHASFTRWLRFIGAAMAVLLPGCYVALQLYHYSIIPIKFLVTIANTTSGLPFTPLFEVVFIILLFEILNEASVRMPQYLGMAMSVVGALILGDTAVKAGLISPPAVMIVALSGITIFTVSDISNQLSLLRIAFTIMGGILGFYGIILSCIFLIAYLNDFDSYGSPYLSPLSPQVDNDFKDYLTMQNITQRITRPKSIKNINHTRQKRKNKKYENEKSNC